MEEGEKMNVLDKLIKHMEKEGTIKNENLSHRPRNDLPIKKIRFWYNPTPISARWDCEVWYEGGSHERLAKISSDSKRLFIERTITQ